MVSYVHTMKRRTGRYQNIYSKAVLEGACLDTGAEQYVIWKEKACAYTFETRRSVRPTDEPLKFRFGDRERRSTGILEVRIPIPGGRNIGISVHIVNADIKMLIGLGIICAQRLVLDLGKMKVRDNNGELEMPMVRKPGQMFLVWKRRNICYS